MKSVLLYGCEGCGFRLRPSTISFKFLSSGVSIISWEWPNVQSDTEKEESWTAKEQLKAVHAAGVGKSGLLLGESQKTDVKSGYWLTSYVVKGRGGIMDDDDDD